MGIRARATATVAGLVAAPVLAVGAAQAAAPEPGTQQGGEVAQTGWWSSFNEPPPDNPLTPPPPPPAPDVPPGALAVTVLTGEPRRLSAIELALEGEPGASVDSVELSLRESADRALTANAGGAVILACAVTEAFWVGGENSPWKNRPEHDCEAGSAPGVRDAATGTWTFDLTGLAADWKAEDFFGSPSVVLVGAAAGETGEPLSFQVVFDGVEAKGIGLAGKTTDAPASGGSGPDPKPGAGAADGGGSNGSAGSDGSDTDSSGGTGGVGTGAGDSGGGGLADLGGGGDLAVDDLATDAPPPAQAEPTEAAPEAATQTGRLASVAAPSLPWYDGLTTPAFLLVPLALVLAYLVMLAMGPAAQPAGAANRRGVSRALDKLRLAGAGLAAKAGR